jgi:hypothetical protein
MAAFAAKERPSGPAFKPCAVLDGFVALRLAMTAVAGMQERGKTGLAVPGEGTLP